MPGDMKFEEPLLTEYLVKLLEPLTEADPSILAEYIVALLKKDKPSEELQNLCTDNLVEFLGEGTKPFIAKLFQALEDGSMIRTNNDIDSINKLDSSGPPTRLEEPPQVKNLLPNEDASSLSESASDQGAKDVSDDDDDDDRNHKHRRRVSQPDSLEKDAEEGNFQRNRKRNKPYAEDGRFQSEYQKFGSQVRSSIELGSRARVSKVSHTDVGPRFDFSSHMGRPSGRGKGRSMAAWNHHDSRFNTLESFDFASQIVSQGHPNLFMGTGLPGAVNIQSSSWSPFGLVPGISNGIFDPLNSLGLPGTLRPPLNTTMNSLNAPLNLGLPRPRCRDFEERGFCLRGDMCPMEHGVNRIVVDDVQSLSQFNLPVSIPMPRSMGAPAGAGCLPSVTTSSNLMISKEISGRNSKTGLTGDTVPQNGVSSASGGAEADVYDPDQPLWNSDRPEASGVIVGISPPNFINEHISVGVSSSSHDLRSSENIVSDRPSKKFTSRSTNTSVWGRVRSGNKMESTRTASGHLGNDSRVDLENATTCLPAHSQGKDHASVSSEPGEPAMQHALKASKYSSHHPGKTTQQASRTLYVNGLPQQSNRRDALFSHFRKFGDVIDIRIPSNSEKAFVQFSKREEAEAALHSPDAVMGNRFIKLWWAKRDSILDDGKSNPNLKTRNSTGIVLSSAPSQPTSQPILGDDGRAHTPSSSSQVGSSRLAMETTSAPPSKILPVTNSKVSALQKKLFLDEIRRKQEALEKKREDFRRQLLKFEEQGVKKQKVDKDNDAAKAAPSEYAIGVAIAHPDMEEDKRISLREIPVISCSALNSTVQLPLPKNSKHVISVLDPSSSEFLLSSGLTSFRVLPPLPLEIANVDALKEHFNSFPDLYSVVIEDPAVSSVSKMEVPQNLSAVVTFTKRHAAEKAFQNGGNWKGLHLSFEWLEIPFGQGSKAQKMVPICTDTIASSRVQPEPFISTLSSSGKTNSICDDSSKGADCGVDPVFVVESSTDLPEVKPPIYTTSPSPKMPLCKTSTPKPGIPAVEGSTNMKISP